MAEKDTTLEERMSPEERELYERWKGKIGEVWVPPSLKERLYTKRGEPLLYGLSREVCWELVQRWILATEDLNPLWLDEECAKKSKWGGIIVPPLYLLLVDDGMEISEEMDLEIWKPGTADLEPSTERSDNFPSLARGWSTHTEFEFFEPLRLGDRVETTVKLADVYWKQGRQYRLLFFEAEITYTNQKGQLVANGRSGWAFGFE